MRRSELILHTWGGRWRAPDSRKGVLQGPRWIPYHLIPCTCTCCEPRAGANSLYSCSSTHVLDRASGRSLISNAATSRMRATARHSHHGALLPACLGRALRSSLFTECEQRLTPRRRRRAQGGCRSPRGPQSWWTACQQRSCHDWWYRLQEVAHQSSQRTLCH